MTTAAMALVCRLAELYPGAEESAMLMARIHMQSARIQIERPPITRWYAIVNECIKAGLLVKLMEAMLIDYPTASNKLLVEHAAKNM